MSTTMETQNITLAIPKDILREVKIIAARRGTSISGLMVHTLTELVQKQDEYEIAMRHHLEMLEHGFDLGTGGEITWSRDELHER